MTLVLIFLRALGLPLCITIGLLGFYEGVPSLRDLPFVDRLPVVREIIAGRVEVERIKAAAAARHGYVLQIEKIAAEQQLAEVRRQLAAADQSLRIFQRRAEADSRADAERQQELDNVILSYEVRLSQAGRRCTLDADDLSTILRE